MNLELFASLLALGVSLGVFARVEWRRITENQQRLKALYERRPELIGLRGKK